MAEGRVYTAQFEGTAVTAAVDLFELIPATNKPISVHGLFIAQASDLGDAAEEILRYQVIRGHATSGSGGSSGVAPVPVDEFDAAAGFSYETCNTTQASTGTAVVLHSGAFNIRVGEALWLPPEDRWKCSAGANRLVVRLMAAPTDSLTMSGTIYAEEL